MAWDDIVGHERVKNILRRSIASGRVSHAYLLSGPDGIGKDALALEFAATLQCREGGEEACGTCPGCTKARQLTHPDIRLVTPLPTGKNENPGDDPFEKLPPDVLESYKDELRQKAADPYYDMSMAKAQFIKINSIRAVRKEASRTPVEGRYKIFLILGADAMHAESGNALLKTLEEPLPNAVLVLTTSYRDRLLPTIVSRCQQVECAALSEQDIAEALTARDALGTDEAEALARIAHGSLVRARRMIGGDVEADRTAAVQFLRTALGQSPTQLSESVEAIVAGNDRSRVERLLDVMQSWLREALLTRHGASPGRSDEVRDRFLERFSDAPIEDALGLIDEAIADTRRNVYLPLILTSLAHQIRDSLSGRTVA